MCVYYTQPAGYNVSGKREIECVKAQERSALLTFYTGIHNLKSCMLLTRPWHEVSVCVYKKSESCSGFSFIDRLNDGVHY